MDLLMGILYPFAFVGIVIVLPVYIHYLLDTRRKRGKPSANPILTEKVRRSRAEKKS